MQHTTPNNSVDGPHNGIVVSLFDVSGTMITPWLNAGYLCYILDIQHPPGYSRIGNLVTVGIDLSKPLILQNIIPNEISFVSAFPPCTHLAISGARWFRGKGLRLLSESIELFATAAEFCESTDAPYMIENPISTISTYWRKPDYMFHPYMFTGYRDTDNYTKKTCLWTNERFRMPAEFRNKALGKPDNRIANAPETKERATIRSATPVGFAKAVYEANKNPIPQNAK